MSGAVTGEDDFDLHLLSMSRVVSADDRLMTLEVTFTASKQPDVKFLYYDDRTITIPCK